MAKLQADTGPVLAHCSIWPLTCCITPVSRLTGEAVRYVWAKVQISIMQTGTGCGAHAHLTIIAHRARLFDRITCKEIVRWLTHWPLGDFNDILDEYNFHVNFSHWWLMYLLWNCRRVIVTGPHWWYVDIGSGNGLVLSGNKPLPEQMLTQIYVAIWRH